MHALLLASIAFVDVADALRCNTTYTWYSWATNANALDPCQLVSDLYNLCAPDADPLPPLSYHPSATNFYPGPNSSLQNSCTCSYIMYNLMSACSDCQLGLSAPTAWPTYIDWARACNASNTDGIHSTVLPDGFSSQIPVWARFSMTGDYRWSYSLSRAIAVGHISNTKLDHVLATASSSPCPSNTSPALPIGTAFAGLVLGLLLALLVFLLQRRRRSRVIPPPTRYHTTPDNTPLHPLVPRPAHSHGTNFLRRILEHEHENSPNRIEPFDISAAACSASFPPHPAVFPPRRGHTFPPALSIQSSSRGPSRQPSASSLNAITFAPPPPIAHSRSYSQSKPGTRPQTAASQFSMSGPPVPGPSMVPLQSIPPPEPSSPLPQDHSWPEALEDPPAYRRKS